MHLDRFRTRPYNLGSLTKVPPAAAMSYRTFKRVLGETSLERKCRWWFGVSLAVLLTLSFTWYGRRTDQIVKDLNHTFTGPELVRAGWLATHLSHLDEVEKNAVEGK